MTNKLSVDYFAHIPYLCALAPPQQACLQQSAIYHVFRAQELIFLEGDPALGLWIIKTGWVKIVKFNTSGDEYILHLLNEGESFNDIAALEDGFNPAHAIALTQVRCWLIPTHAIQHLVATHPPTAQAAIRMLTTRVRSLVQQLEDLALYSVTARLARFLLQQAESSMMEGGVTRVTIAAHLATTPETISRSLRHLEEIGAIEFNRHQIEIIQPAMLRALAYQHPT